MRMGLAPVRIFYIRSCAGGVNMPYQKQIVKFSCTE